MGNIISEDRIQLLISAAQDAVAPLDGSAKRASALVDIRNYAPDIQIDLKYATGDNFLGYPLYTGTTALLQDPVASSLANVQMNLKAGGMGLIVYDAYRPWWVTKVFWDAMPVEARTFLANPESGSRHNRGCAVDLGLTDLASGSILDMPSGFDEFTERAYVSYEGGSDEARRNRDTLIEAMTRESFDVYSAEWWHYDHITWSEFQILNEPVP